MTEFDPDLFQAEVMKWTSHNFPNADTYEPLLGIVEEMGELYAAHALPGKEEQFKIQREQKLDDAVGDIMVFLAHYCGLNGYELMSCARDRQPDHPMFSPFPLWELVEAVGKLCHAHLKTVQKIRGHHRDEAKAQIGNIVSALRLFCENQKQELTEVVDHVWGEVKRRDWKKFPKDGGYVPKPRVREALEALSGEVPF